MKKLLILVLVTTLSPDSLLAKLVVNRPGIYIGGLCQGGMGVFGYFRNLKHNNSLS